MVGAREGGPTFRGPRRVCRLGRPRSLDRRPYCLPHPCRRACQGVRCRGRPRRAAGPTGSGSCTSRGGPGVRAPSPAGRDVSSAPGAGSVVDRKTRPALHAAWVRYRVSLACAARLQRRLPAVRGSVTGDSGSGIGDPDRGSVPARECVGWGGVGWQGRTWPVVARAPVDATGDESSGPSGPPVKVLTPWNAKLRHDVNTSAVHSGRSRYACRPSAETAPTEP